MIYLDKREEISKNNKKLCHSLPYILKHTLTFLEPLPETELITFLEKME